ncbi:MAG: phosphatase PAP2 family protein, partial [Bryobacteraceae bacterium]
MDKSLAGPQLAAAEQNAPAGFWPVDVLIIGYLAATCLLTALWFRRIPYAAWLLLTHAAAIALILAAVKAGSPNRDRNGAVGESGFLTRALRKLRLVFRYVYPLPYVAASYKVTAILIPVVRGVSYDRRIASLDFALWHANPTVWIERLYSPALTEFLQIAYTLFVPAVLLPAVLLWRRQRYAEFRFFAFLIALGYLASYVGYYIVPVRGPRFLLADLQHVQLRGVFLFEPLQHLLDRLESAHYDCFPSGHVELTILAWWSTRKLSNRQARMVSSTWPL